MSVARSKIYPTVFSRPLGHVALKQESVNKLGTNKINIARTSHAKADENRPEHYNDKLQTQRYEATVTSPSAQMFKYMCLDTSLLHWILQLKFDEF